MLIITAFSLLYIYKSKENYYLVVRVYNIIEFSLLAYFFSFYLKNRLVKKLLLLLSLGYFLFCLYDFLKETEPQMPFIPLSIEHILLLIIIIYYFFEVMQVSTIEPIYQRAIFWISVAFIINSAGNFFLFLYSKNSFNDDAFKKQYTLIYTTVTVLKNLLLCIAISMKEKPADHPQTDFLDVELDSFNPIKKQN